MNIFSEIVYHLTRLTKILIQLLIVWFIVVLVIPGINWYEHVYWLGSIIVVTPTAFIYNFFTEFWQSIVAEDWSNHNPIQDAVYIMLYLGGIALSLALPVLLWLSMLFITLDTLTGWTKIGTTGSVSADNKNIEHLLTGRTTIGHTYDADVIANAIASKK